jgi:hypothetical protein
VTLTYRAGRYPLYLSAASRADTTPFVRDPSGNWLCNDDMEGLNQLQSIRWKRFRKPLRAGLCTRILLTCGWVVNIDAASGYISQSHPL